MINLLPTEQRKATLYARRNTILVRWLTGILAATAGIAVITGGSLFYLKQDSSALRNDIDKTKADLVAQNEKETLERVEQMSGNLKLAVNVLSNEVLFSKLLQSIGLIMPPGTVLKSLSLTNNIASQGIDLEIGAISYETGTRAHVNLNDAENGIFDKADLQSVTCNEADTETIYVCTVSIRALFKSDNPFLLIGKDGS
jgi:Tfp pilus assembly protein PilN